jgi:PcRGLX-like N-terminal RIFT barrel domain
MSRPRTVQNVREVTIAIDVDIPIGGRAAYPVSVGCPLPEGCVHDAELLRAHSEEGPCPLVARPLLHWPDGSVRWVLLSFVTRQQGEHTVSFSGPEPTGWSGVSIRDDGADMRIDNGVVQVLLSRTGGGPIQEIRARGVPWLSSAKDLQFLVDDASSLNGGTESIDVLEHSAIRARLRVSGKHKDDSGAHLLDYSLYIEIWSEVPTIRLDYEFANVTPGIPEQDVNAIVMNLRPELGPHAVPQLLQRWAGERMQAKLATPNDDTEIVADWTRAVPYVPSLACFGDREPVTRYLEQRVLESDSWLGLKGPSGSLYLKLHDMANLRPKRLLTCNGSLIAELWPSAAGRLGVPQGRSRRHSLTLVFTPPDTALSLQAIGELLQLPLYEGRATVAPEVFAASAAFGQDKLLAFGRSARFEHYLARLTNQVNLATGIFDYGDTVDQDYALEYALEGRQPLRRGREIRQWSADTLEAIRPGDISSYEPVWTNNEYDLVHMLCTEVMRTGRRWLWPTLLAAARHNVEVDFVRYSDDPYQHEATPAHSAYHNFSRAVPSHTWTQGLLEYHCLTGDPDALETATKLGDRLIWHLESRDDLWGFNRELGWSLLSLTSLFDVTGAERFRAYAEKLVSYLTAYDLGENSKPVHLSNSDPRDDIFTQIVTSFFGYASMVEGLALYHSLCYEPELHDWLLWFLNGIRVTSTRLLLAGGLSTVRQRVPFEFGPIDPVRWMIPQAMAIGYEMTGDTNFLDVGMMSLEVLMDTNSWVEPPKEGKAPVKIYRGIIRFLKPAEEQGLLRQLDYHFAEPLRSSLADEFRGDAGARSELSPEGRSLHRAAAVGGSPPGRD